MSSEFLIVRDSLKSSANKYTSLLTMCGMSLTNIVKSRGPIQNPACGTPLASDYTLAKLDIIKHNTLLSSHKKIFKPH